MEPRQADDVRERLDEHGNVLDRHGNRLNEHDRQLRDVTHMLIGEPEKRYTGVLERLDNHGDLIREMLQWKRDVRIGAYVTVAILTVIAAGVWQPQLKSILTLLGG